MKGFLMKAPKGSSRLNEGSPKRPPFAWQDKRALRRIREQCPDPGTALAVYHALTEVASDFASEEFNTTHAYLAGKSGFSARTVRNRLADLVQLKVVTVKTPRLKAPSTYRLLPFDAEAPATGNGCRTLGNGKASALPSSEETKETNCHTPASAGPTFPTIEEVKIRAQSIGLPEWKAVDFFHKLQAVNWRLKGQPVTNWQALLDRETVFWESDGRPASPPTRGPRQPKPRPDTAEPDFTTGVIDTRTL